MRIKFCVLFLIFHFSIPIVAQEDTSFIEWSEGVNLEWEDFKGKPESNGYSAVSDVGIVIENLPSKGRKKPVIVVASFDKSKSWKKAQSEELLRHEKGHFDIAEIYARLLRKKLNKKRFTVMGFYKDVSRIYDITLKELASYHDLYDEETDHSANEAKQNEWNEIIAVKLKSLKKYSNPQITIKIRGRVKG